MKSVLLVILLLPFFGLQARGIGMPQEAVIRVAHNQNQLHPWHVGFLRLKEALAELSQGKMSLTIYSDAVLGNEAEVLQAVKNGVIDLTVTDPSLGTGYARELEVFALPFLFRSYEHWESVLDGEIGQRYAQLIESKTGLKILAYWGGSVRNVIAVKKPLLSIDDLQGFKLRLAASQLKFRVWSAVGALPTEIAFSETYSALQAGVVDGMENEYPSIFNAKFYEAAPYFAKTEHEITVRPLFMSLQRFNKLSAEEQDILLQAGRIATIEARKAELLAGQEALEVMTRRYNAEENLIDKTPFKERVADVFRDFGQRNGLVQFIDDISNF